MAWAVMAIIGGSDGPIPGSARILRVAVSPSMMGI